MSCSQVVSESPVCRRFFKALIDDFRTKISLPVAFSRVLLSERSMKSALLATCKGLWPVKLEESDRGVLFFKDGWEDFVNHHGLMLGDFVVFEHKGNMIFHVLAYDASACEKEFPPSVPLADDKNIASRVREKVCSKILKGKQARHKKKKQSMNNISTKDLLPAIEWVDEKNVYGRIGEKVLSKINKGWTETRMRKRKHAKRENGKLGREKKQKKPLYGTFAKEFLPSDGMTDEKNISGGFDEQVFSKINSGCTRTIKKKQKCDKQRSGKRVRQMKPKETLYSISLEEFSPGGLADEKNISGRIDEKVLSKVHKGKRVRHKMQKQPLCSITEEFSPSIGFADEKNISDRIDEKVCSKVNKGKRVRQYNKQKGPLYGISGNPYYVAKIVPSNATSKAYMYMPCKFARQNGIVGRSFVTLRDSSGQLWPVRINNRTKEGRCFVSMGVGWNDFFVAHKLKVGDRCIFELNPRIKRSNDVVIDVSISP